MSHSVPGQLARGFQVRHSTRWLARPSGRVTLHHLRSTGFERIDKTANAQEDQHNRIAQPLDLPADQAPISPDEEDPEINAILNKVERGGLQDMKVEDEDDEQESAGQANLTPEQMQQMEQMRQAMSRKAQILIALLRLGPAAAEKMEEIQAEIDPLMLDMLDGRTRTAIDMGEPQEMVEAMQRLSRMLHRTMNRRAATPALRLLDDLLAILGDVTAGDPEYPPRRLEAANRMQEAFTGRAAGVDIFEAAAALAQDSRTAGEMLSTEFVFLEDFMGEVMELLKGVEEGQRQLAEALRQRAALLRKVKEVGQEALEHPETLRLLEEAEVGKDVYQRRRRSILQIQDLILIARQLEIQTSPARQATQGQ